VSKGWYSSLPVGYRHTAVFCAYNSGITHTLSTICFLSILPGISHYIVSASEESSLEFKTDNYWSYWRICCSTVEMKFDIAVFDCLLNFDRCVDNVLLNCIEIGRWKQWHENNLLILCRKIQNAMSVKKSSQVIESLMNQCQLHQLVLAVIVVLLDCREFCWRLIHFTIFNWILFTGRYQCQYWWVLWICLALWHWCVRQWIHSTS